MIHYEEFYDAMKELSDLTGNRITSDTVKALHRVLNGSDINDFRTAVVAVAESGEKPNLYSLRKQINLAQSARLERESLQRKRIEEQETIEFWKAHFKAGQCQHHNCGRCPKSFCTIVSNASIREVKGILSGEATVQESHVRLAHEFPGIGFEIAAGEEAF